MATFRILLPYNYSPNDQKAIRFVIDAFAAAGTASVTGLAMVYAKDYLVQQEIYRGEYYTLLLFAIAGMILMGMSSDLIMVFLSLELLSIPLYVLAGIASPKADSEESSLKYFLLGAFSSGFVVYGTALVYGSTATTGAMWSWRTPSRITRPPATAAAAR